MGLPDAKLDGHRPKRQGGAERHRKDNVSSMALVFWRRTLPKSPEVSGMAAIRWSRPICRSVAVLTVGAGFRRCMSPARDEGRPLVVGEIEAKSSRDWANSAGLARECSILGLPYQQ